MTSQMQYQDAAAMTRIAMMRNSGTAVATRPDFDFGGEDSWREEIQPAENGGGTMIKPRSPAVGLQQQHSQHQNQPMHSYHTVTTAIAPQSQWMETDDPAFPQYQNRPATSGGRTGRARFHLSPQQQEVYAPTGTTFQTVVAQPNPSNPEVAPIYSEAHAMHLYNPNEVSWAGDSVPPADAVGLTLDGADSIDGNEFTLINQSSPLEQEEIDSIQIEGGLRANDDGNAEEVQTTSRPASRVSYATESPRVFATDGGESVSAVSRPSSTRPKSRTSYILDPTAPATHSQPVTLQSQTQTHQHSANTAEPVYYPAGWLPSRVAPVGTQFQTVYAEPRPSNTNIAPIYSQAHGMHLYNPNQISWAGASVPPMDRTGLRPATASQQPGDQPHEGLQWNYPVMPGAFPSLNAPAPNSSHLVLPGAQVTSDAIVHNQVSIDENGNRVVKRFVETAGNTTQQQQQHQHPSITSPSAQRQSPQLQQVPVSAYPPPPGAAYQYHMNGPLPPVVMNPSTGLPFPVFSAPHGMNLYIPSEISFVNNVIPPGVPQNFDRGFRQPVLDGGMPLAAYQQFEGDASYSSGSQTARPSTGNARIRVTRSVSPAAVSSKSRPVTAARQPSLSKSRPLTPGAIPTSRSGASTARGAAPSLLRVPTIQRAPSHNRTATPEKLARLSSLERAYAPTGTQFVSAFVDTTSPAPLVYSASHGMNLYNPNNVSWATSTPPIDRVGLKTAGGPVRAYSRPPSAQVSPMNTQQFGASPINNRPYTPGAVSPGGFASAQVAPLFEGGQVSNEGATDNSAESKEQVTTVQPSGHVAQSHQQYQRPMVTRRASGDAPRIVGSQFVESHIQLSQPTSTNKSTAAVRKSALHATNNGLVASPRVPSVVSPADQVAVKASPRHQQLLSPGSAGGNASPFTPRPPSSSGQQQQQQQQRFSTSAPLESSFATESKQQESAFEKKSGASATPSPRKYPKAVRLDL